MSLTKHKDDWEDLGRMDPLWAIFTRPNKKFGKWDTDEFFMTGAQDVETLMQTAARLGYPSGRQVALDFGCGVGRLTRALARHFHQCYGTDISDNMIARARELNSSIPNCNFVVNDQDLRTFPDNYFDLIYTKWVLQHIPDKALIKSYLSELVRSHKMDGLLVFQLRTSLSFRTRLKPWRRLYTILRSFGLKPNFLYRKLGLDPIAMTFVPEEEIAAFLNKVRVKILETQEYRVPSGQGKIYFVTK